MAKIWFKSADGGERPYPLDRYRTLRIGRDPGNDIVLKDARVSRQHAEIQFQRGFFVLHDLASANGSFVNGRKVRVAPLTNGSELKIGNTTGRFVDDPPPGEFDSGTVNISTIARVKQDDIETLDERDRAAPPPAEARSEGMHDDLAAQPLVSEEHPPLTPASPQEQVETAPVPMFDATPNVEVPLPTLADSEAIPESEESVAPFEVEEPAPAGSMEPPATVLEEVPAMTAEVPLSAALPEPPTGDDTRPHAVVDRMALSFYVIDTSNLDRESAVVRDDEDRALFFFRRPIHLVGCIASLVGSLVLVAGAAATAMLVTLHSVLAAVAAAVLTIVFTALIFLLVPRRYFVVCEDAEMNIPALLITQLNRLSVPALRFSVTDARGGEIGTVERSALSRFGRHRWILRDHGSRVRTGYAIQTSLGKALLQNVVGTLFGALRTGFKIYARGKPAGEIGRPPGVSHRLMMNLSADPRMVLDRRVALALAILIDSIETR